MIELVPGWTKLLCLRNFLAGDYLFRNLYLFFDNLRFPLAESYVGFSNEEIREEIMLPR